MFNKMILECCKRSKFVGLWLNLLHALGWEKQSWTSSKVVWFLCKGSLLALLWFLYKGSLLAVAWFLNKGSWWHPSSFSLILWIFALAGGCSAAKQHMHAWLLHLHFQCFKAFGLALFPGTSSSTPTCSAAIARVGCGPGRLATLAGVTGATCAVPLGGSLLKGMGGTFGLGGMAQPSEWVTTWALCKSSVHCCEKTYKCASLLQCNFHWHVIAVVTLWPTLKLRLTGVEIVVLRKDSSAV